MTDFVQFLLRGCPDFTPILIIGGDELSKCSLKYEPSVFNINTNVKDGIRISICSSLHYISIFARRTTRHFPRFHHDVDVLCSLLELHNMYLTEEKYLTMKVK